MYNADTHTHLQCRKPWTKLPINKFMWIKEGRKHSCKQYRVNTIAVGAVSPLTWKIFTAFDFKRSLLFCSVLGETANEYGALIKIGPTITWSF